MNIYLTSFADRRYKASLERIEKEAKYFPFADIYLQSECDLPKDYLSGLHVNIYRRGYGYWKWKSYITKEIYNKKLKEGDILLYIDAGVHLNANGVNRFYDYVDLLSNAKDTGILVFEQPFLEKDYSKGDILVATNSYDNPDVTMSFQYWSGAFMLKKCKDADIIVEKWYEMCHTNFGLITDEKSHTPNLIGFIEHRHDQSALSLIVKQYNHIKIQWNETQALDISNWDSYKSYPILARRTRFFEQSRKLRFCHYLNKPKCIIVGLYLKYVKGFYFKSFIPKY